MKVIRVRNVHQALPEACHQVLAEGIERDSRNGRVIKFDGPLTVRLDRPQERVMFWPERNANPFFHLAEALWMVHGGNDVAFPAWYNGRMTEFSDDGVTFNGAYGHRWRHHFGVDQILSVAEALRANPDCRRQVISMWDARRDLGLVSKDLPCNLQAVLQVNDVGQLDMMVTNRSNDLIWGMLGANAVHFTLLQEVVANLAGFAVGRSWQVSMNAHTYLGTHRELIAAMAAQAVMPPSIQCCPYSTGAVETWEGTVIGLPRARWFRELDSLVRGGPDVSLSDPFLATVAAPVLQAWDCYKAKRTAHAIQAVQSCEAPDWRVACTEWLQRADERRKAKAS